MKLHPLCTRMVATKTLSLIGSFALAFSAPSVFENITRHSISYRSVAKPMVIRFEGFSLASSALEDVRMVPVEQPNTPTPIVIDRLQSDEREFDIKKTLISPDQGKMDWFVAPILTISEYIAEAQAYHPVEITKPLQKTQPHMSATVIADANGETRVYAPANFVAADVPHPTQVAYAPPPRPRTIFPDRNKIDEMLHKTVAALDIASDVGDYHWIKGNIELSQGLAFLAGAQNLRVMRYVNDVPTGEMGQVHFSEGTFRMRVRGAGGHLVASLVDDTGEIVGSGERELTGERGQVIVIKPIAHGLQGQVISAYSFGTTPLAVANARVEVVGTSIEVKSVQDGRFDQAQVATGSQFQLRADKAGFWPTLMIARSGQEAKLPLFPNKMVDALIDLSVGRGRLSGGIVWGQVLLDGHPLKDAQVEMAGGNFKPVYFDAFGSVFMPNPVRVMTSENGYFAFVGAPEGVQSVRVILPGQVNTQVQVLPVRNDHITYATIEMSKLNKSFLQVTDGMEFNKGLNATLRWLGAEEVMNYNTVDIQPDITMLGGHGLQVLEIDAGKAYPLARQSLTPSNNKVHLSPVKTDWINKAYEFLGVAAQPGTGAVVGLLQGDAFTADMESPQWSAEIAYFNQDGEFVKDSSEARNGGFVMLNVPEGLQSVQILSRRTQKRAVKLIVAEQGYVNIIHHQFLSER